MDRIERLRAHISDNFVSANSVNIEYIVSSFFEAQDRKDLDAMCEMVDEVLFCRSSLSISVLFEIMIPFHRMWCILMTLIRWKGR